MIKQKNALQNAERFSVLFQIKCNTRLPCQAETAQIRLISADIQADTSVGRHAPSIGKHGTHPISLGFENNRSALPRMAHTAQSWKFGVVVRLSEKAA